METNKVKTDYRYALLGIKSKRGHLLALNLETQEVCCLNGSNGQTKCPVKSRGVHDLVPFRLSLCEFIAMHAGIKWSEVRAATEQELKKGAS